MLKLPGGAAAAAGLDPGRERASSRPGRTPWDASLWLTLGWRAGRTRVAEAGHRGPLRLQRLFHPEPDGTGHAVVLHPPGGLVSGDRLRLRFEVQSGQALVTTVGATKLYRSSGTEASQHTELHVAAGATLEHVPQPAIVFDGARGRVTTRAVLEEGAELLVWDVACFGRPANGMRFEHGSAWLGLEVVDADGTPRLIERGRYEGGGPLLSEPWGLGGMPAIGTLVATAGEIDAVRALDDPRLSATRLDRLLVVRARGRDGEEVRRALEPVRHLVRDAWGRPRVDPGIWRT